jgi:hypothetical protein
MARGARRRASVVGAGHVAPDVPHGPERGHAAGGRGSGAATSRQDGQQAGSEQRQLREGRSGEHRPIVGVFALDLPAGAELPFTREVPKPPVPPAQPQGLDEVERAISVLEGRHPEHERTRRETIAAAEARRHVLDKEAAAGSRRRRRRIIVVLANATALGAAAIVGWRLLARAHALRALLEHEEAPFLAAGLTEMASNELTARATLEADTPGASCFVALATDGLVRVRQDAMSLEAQHSAGWCTCAPGRVVLETTGAGGLSLMRIDARAVGGPLARPWSPFTPSVWGDTGTDCSEASLDDWIGEHRAPTPAIDDAWLVASPARAPLKRAGFRVVSRVDPARPFGVVESTAGDCMLAVAGAGDVLSLRLTGGARPIARAPGAIAWCDGSATTTTVWRDGHGEVIVIAAPGARIGGLLGARECAESAGMHVTQQATWLRDSDLGWSATSLLHASTLSDITTAELTTEPGDPDGRVAALALSAAVRAESAPADVVVACDPSRDSTPAERTMVCASARPVAWWRRTEGPAFAARAPLPLWLSTLASHTEPDAVARIPEVLALARRLSREGFEPTVLEGVVELTDGVRVVGRAGENAIVAVGLAPKAPWVFPYTDGIPWDLGDPPRAVDLQPGTAVKLVASPAPSAPVDKRRTVVFRRSAMR